MELRALTDGEIGPLAEFLARENNRPERHVPYVGLDPAGIAKEIRELPPLGARGWIVGTRGDAIVAAIGAELDEEVGRAWLQGPFAPDDDWQGTADRLLEAVTPLVPAAIGELELSGDQRNGDIAGFAERHGFNRFGHSHLMELSRGELSSDAEALGELPAEFDEQVAALHDAEFPRTYYTAGQLREMSGGPGTPKVLLGLHEGGRLHGYVFAEVDPEVDDSDVHFIAVHPQARGRGVGRRLLEGALRWMFTHDGITKVGLVVRVDNPSAIALYRSAGFEVVRTMYGWRKQR